LVVRTKKALYAQAEVAAALGHAPTIHKDISWHEGEPQARHGDIIQWDQSNRAHIMTRGVSGVDWKHYKYPLPENVYGVYMQYWEDVEL